MKPTSRLKAQLDNLPEPIRASTRFLVWKYVPVKGKKPRKIPFYSSGRARQGDLDTPGDLTQLTTLPEALKALDQGFDGIGLALVKGDGIGAFDLDYCLTPDGELLPNHPGTPIAQEAEARGAYMEISPSGKGIRILGPCKVTEAYSKGGLEYWGAGRYVTLTGSLWAAPKGWVSIQDLREPLTTPKPSSIETDDDEPIVTPRTIRDLKSALYAIPSDERDLWIRTGLALKPLGDKGKQLWIEWSQKSDKFDEADAHRVWETFRPSRIDHKSIFNEAKTHGWNPKSPKPPQEGPEDDSSSEEEEQGSAILRNAINLGDQKLFPTEFVLDGFLPVGVTLVAGAWGAGKSTNLIPLFASVAHLAPQDWGFRPQLRRHVIWITEAPDQARDTIYSLSKAEGSAPWEEFKEWFHLIPARRSDPVGLARALRKAVRETTYDLPVGVHGSFPEATQFKVRPVIILDTTSANLDLENESDNSEVGAAMAALKEKLPGIPLVLVGHTPKAMLKSDIADMTFRGAGAWEADAVATYYLVFDPDTDMRFMAIRKCRFTPDYTEVSFGQAGGREMVDTPWGDTQSKAYMHGVPCRSDGEERKVAQKAVREEKAEMQKERTLTDRQTRILDEIGKAAAEGRGMTKTTLREKIGGKAELVSQALSRLIESHLVISVTPSPEILELLGFIRRGPPPEILLPAEVDPEVFYAIVQGREKP